MDQRSSIPVRAIVIFKDGSESKTDWYETDDPNLLDSLLKLGRAPRVVNEVRWQCLTSLTNEP
jgi:hypothetical protein